MGDYQTTRIVLPPAIPLTLDDVLEALSVVQLADGSFARRPVTMGDIVRLLADEMERRQA